MKLSLPTTHLCLFTLGSVLLAMMLWRWLPVGVNAQVEIVRPKPAPKPKPMPRPTAKPRQMPAPVNINIEMVELPGGTFTMGSNDGGNDEKPPHQVTVSPFSIGKYEVTQAQYRAVMGINPSYFKGDDRPVELVTWNDAIAFCQKLSISTGRPYRLPTEAEWEYACRAGSNSRYSFGGDAGQLGEYAWRNDHQTHSVGQKKSNAFGLYDMHGNVWEWCADWYDSNYYSQSPRDNPQGPAFGLYRVRRGGSWANFDYGCRSAARENNSLGNRQVFIGFRVVVSASPQ